MTNHKDKYMIGLESKEYVIRKSFKPTSPVFLIEEGVRHRPVDYSVLECFKLEKEINR